MYGQWAQALLSRIVDSIDCSRFDEACRELNVYLKSGTNVLERLTLSKKIFARLDEARRAHGDEFAPALFTFYNTEITIRNHEGDYEGAAVAYDNCMQYAAFAGLDEVLRMRNTKSVFLCDSGRYDEAVEFTKATMDYQAMLLEIKKEVYPSQGDIYLNYGRTISQLGQCLALKGDFARARQCFEDSLKYMEGSTFNQNTTLSYLLHLLVEMGDMKAYDEVAATYFGKEKPRDQVRRLDNLRENAWPYAMYIFLKGMFYFHIDHCSEALFNDIEKSVAKFKPAEHEHPWEMLYKYCAFIAYRLGKQEASHRYMELAGSAIEAKIGIIGSLVENNAAEYELLTAGKDIKGKYGFFYH